MRRSALGRAWLEGRRRRRSLDFYAGFLGPSSLCFDVGANVGDRADLFLALGARVVAVEPQSACADVLRDRFTGQAGLVVEPVALGSSPGTAEIAICESDPTISTMSDSWQREGRFAGMTWNARETVRVTTLDQLVSDHGRPDFCKIDVEGFESDVLEGLSSPLPCLSFEFTEEFLPAARKCVSLLEELGPVATNVSLGESMRLSGDWDTPSGLFRRIEELADGVLWGDIYVRSTPAQGHGDPRSPSSR